MKQVIYGQKSIGYYDENTNIYSKKVKKTKHLFRKTDSWGIDEHLFTNILVPNKAAIFIYDTEEQIQYELAPETITELLEIKAVKYLKFGEHGLQVFIPRMYWKKEKTMAVEHLK